MAAAPPSRTPARLGRSSALRVQAERGGVRRVRARIRRLYGASALPEVALLQPVAVHRDRSARLRVLAIGKHAPASRTDGFALGLARARADAILTTGRILRAEPGLDGTGPISKSLARDLQAWRRQVSGRLTPPVFAILTSGQGFPRTHRLLRSGVPVIVLVPPAGLHDLRRAAGPLRVHRPTSRDMATLRRRMIRSDRAQTPAGYGGRHGRGLDVVVVPDLDGVRAVALLRQALGLACVSLEAGPTTARELRRNGVLPDELLLSVHEGELSADATSPGELPRLAALRRIYGPARSRTLRREGEGRWTFLRFARFPARVRQRRCAMPGSR